MLLFLTLLFTPANAATNVCPLPNLTLDRPLLTRYAADSARLPTPKLFRTEANPEFSPDNPTTFWAMPTAGSTVEVKVHHATTAPTAGGTSIDVIWVDTIVTIDPATETVSGADECDVLHSTVEHILEILNVIQEPGAPH